MAWPKGMSVMTAGVVESFASGLVCLPFIAVELAVASDAPGSGPLGYVLLLATLFMWVVERICFFGAIDKLGPVTAVLAVYVSTPAAVLFGFAFFRETVDLWLIVCLGLLMLALWLDNRARASGVHQPDDQRHEQRHTEPVAAVDQRR